MSRIQELPDDFDDSSKPNGFLDNTDSTPFPIRPTEKAQDDTTPELPPPMQAVRSHTADDIVKMMSKTPLFMTSLDNEDGDEENIGLEAIRALQYEGSPSENAQSFKEQGNDMVKNKRWKDAKEFYNNGVAVLSKKNQSQEQKSDNSQEELQKQKEVEEACLVNRALCNLQLKNYRSTTLDCRAALRLNARSVKAYYRSALALLALDKIPEASDACTRGLAIDPINSALKSLADRIRAREATLAAIERKTREKEERSRKEKTLLTAALQTRGIRLRKTAQPPDLEDARIHLAPDPLSPTSALHFPVVLLYPMHAQSDFIKAVAETDTITQHLEYILPLPWDEKNEYQSSKVELYMETATGGLIKVGKNMSLLKVLGSGEMDVVDELVTVNVVIKSQAGAWIETMKHRSGQ